MTLEELFGKLADHKDALSQVAVQLAIDKQRRELWGLAKKIHGSSLDLQSAATQEMKQDAIKTLSEIEAGNAPEVVKVAARQAKSGNQGSVAQLQTSNSK